MVGGGVGADAPPPVVAPQQPVVAPLQLPPQQQLLLQRVQQQQLVLRQLLGQMQGGQGSLLGGLPGGILPDVPQLLDQTLPAPTPVAEVGTVSVAEVSPSLGTSPSFSPFSQTGFLATSSPWSSKSTPGRPNQCGRTLCQELLW